MRLQNQSAHAHVTRPAHLQFVGALRITPAMLDVPTCSKTALHSEPRLQPWLQRMGRQPLGRQAGMTKGRCA